MELQPSRTSNQPVTFNRITANNTSFIIDVIDESITITANAPVNASNYDVLMAV